MNLYTVERVLINRSYGKTLPESSYSPCRAATFRAFANILASRVGDKFQVFFSDQANAIYINEKDVVRTPASSNHITLMVKVT